MLDNPMIIKVVHNTDPDSAESILRNGFDISRFGYATKKSGQNSTFGIHPKGIYFTKDTGQESPSAHPWDHRKTGRLIRCTVELKNPLVIEPFMDGKFYQNWLYEKYGKKGAALTNALKKEGYDGIIAGDEIIAFNTEGIKMESQGFREWIVLEMTSDEAVRVLGLKPGEDVKSAYRRASLRNHPDRGGSESFMKEINRAFEVLSGKKSEPKTSPPRRESYSNLDYCLQVIEEESSKKGQTRPYTLWAWDGMYFRGVFTAKTNTESFPFAAKVMEMWNDSFPHDTKAVFVDIGEKELLLLRKDRKDVSGEKRTFVHDSFNRNPGNDRQFVDELRNSL